ARPRPVPLGLVVYQGAKTREASPSKPGPVSQTVSSPPEGGDARSPPGERRPSTPPDQVRPTRPPGPAASSALESRLTRTCITWSASQRIVAGPSISTSSVRLP